MRLRLENFGCWEKKDVEFSEGLTLLSGQSGAGKTTLLRALYFALYGTGSKLVRYGCTSCAVEFWFDDLYVKRSKRPNRLVVRVGGECYEDDYAQSIIETRFGRCFSVMGYIAQNPAASFVLMSPRDKLSFIEKIALDGVDIDKMKSRAKEKIREFREELVASTSGAEVIGKMLSNTETDLPQGLEFPVKCDPSFLENSERGAEIRDKMMALEELRHDKIKARLDKYAAKLSALELSIAGMHVEDIDVLEANLSNLQSELAGVEWSDGKIHALRARLHLIEARRDAIKKREMLEGQKRAEKAVWDGRMKDISGKLWKDYTREEAEAMLKDYEEMDNDAKQLKYWMGFKWSGDDELERLERERKKMSKESVMQCPGCSMFVSKKDGRLSPAEGPCRRKWEDASIIDRIDRLHSKKRKWEDAQCEMKKITAKWEIPENYSKEWKYLRRWFAEMEAMESEAARPFVYSSTLLKMERSLPEIDDSLEEASSLEEALLRRELEEQLINKERGSAVANRVSAAEEGLRVARRRHIEKGEMERKREKLKSVMASARAQYDPQLYQKIQRWRGYERQLAKVRQLRDELDGINSKMNVASRKLAASTELHDKILEAESIAVISVIENINSHAKTYLDGFFQDEPMQVILEPFKETSKKTKPQINMTCIWKAMECGVDVLSGGELARVVLAFTLALADIFEMPLVMLDESVASLDQDSCFEVVTQIKNHLPSRYALMVCHQVIKGIFDNTIEIE